LPAITPARLKIQAEQLLEHVHEPSTYVRSLKAMMEQYADRTHRSGQSGRPPSLLPAYKVPPPVLRQVILSLKPTIRHEPATILSLCDVLWLESNLECRTVAASLLGQMHLSEDAVVERLQIWLSSSSEVAERGAEDRILEALLESGLAPVRRSNPNRILALAESWLDQKQIATRQAALRSLRYLAAEPSFENFPGIYRLVMPLLRSVPIELRSDLLELLYELVERAPAEAAFVLKQSLITSENPDTPWLIRQLMPRFPEDIRLSLRKALNS